LIVLFDAYLIEIIEEIVSRKKIGFFGG